MIPIRDRVVVSPWAGSELLRSELFSQERLERHARSLAEAQPVTPSSASSRSASGQAVYERVRQNQGVLWRAHAALTRALVDGQQLTPAALWLVDNYHVVAAQVREILRDLPPGYYRQLPKLAAGPLTGYPRVLGIAWALVAHTDSRFDIETVRRFLDAYQSVQALDIAELWAVAITLRIVLVENLRRAAEQIIDHREQRHLADRIADDLLSAKAAAANEQQTSGVPQALAGIADARQGDTTFVVQMLKRLRDQDPQTTPGLLWLEELLESRGQTAETMVQLVHQSQAAMSVSVRNVITSMRMISTVDWNELFESVSLVDATLRQGTGFAEMDFRTRNNYRTAIEQLARGSSLSDLDVAFQVRHMIWDRQRPRGPGVAPVTPGPAADRMDDPGYWLVAEGRPALERSIGFRPPVPLRLRRALSRMGIAGYAGLVGGLTMIIGGAAVAGFDAAQRLLFSLLALLPAADLAISVINRGITRWFVPQTLPALALRQGIPPEFRTLVAVPTLLTSKQRIVEQIERLEIHFLASPAGDLHFALLTDWTDWSAETAPHDAALLRAAVEGIAALNRQYPSGTNVDRFLLLHRRRLWNPVDGVWMGWERKRGKLHELNRMLRGASDTSFVATGRGRLRVPDNVRYVITLDSDTQLPHDAVARLIGKMAHPLNRPIMAPEGNLVVAGHGILQPRVTPSLPTGWQPSPFQYAFSSAAGIDPYAAAISDVYQDLFGEGSYAGKGIYDVDVFEQSLAGRIPQNAMLSHDLFEGIFARAGLATDIEVIEEFPARYDVALSRQHRWTRGDWQLLPWCLSPAVPAVGRWKMLDNLRRSLTAPATVLGLVAGWLLLPLRQAGLWTAFLLVTLALPPLLPVLADRVPHRGHGSVRGYAQVLLADLRLAGVHMGLSLILLVEQATQMGDAIARTLIRLFVTRRRLLEWTTSEQSKAGQQPGVVGHYRRMPASVVLAVLVLGGTLTAAPGVWALMLPFACLWAMAPAVAWWAGRARPAADAPPASAAQEQALRLVARRTWRYFETFVTPADNMLPPDNFQEVPRPVIARRTSPTNIGLYLLSVAAARDFGWIGLVDAVERQEATMNTLDTLERCRGHFYNWYDTGNCRPLDPRYVSSVDSGNLAGHLIAVANACMAWTTEPPVRPAALLGVRDALELTRQALTRANAAGVDVAGVELRLDALDRLVAAMAVGPSPLPDGLAALLSHSEAVVQAAAALSSSRPEIFEWATATQDSALALANDMQLLPDARQLQARLRQLASRARALADQMRFDFLLDPDRKLLSIGFRVSDSSLDPSCYDLLASEARLASFWAIARGDVPVSHWFRLGRAMTPVRRGAALISWSGSMFEYLMPSLVMRAPTGSLLAATNRLIVRRQMDYAGERGLPWGMSESAFNARDLDHTYQYSNFGVPDLALKRGLGENAVIAPYATALAAMVDPAAAADHFVALAARGGLGVFGFYEALDYTPARVPEGHEVAVVRAYMAHHQGMTIVALLNATQDGLMRARFHAEPRVAATELLLQERTPRDQAPPAADAEDAQPGVRAGPDLPASRRLTSPHGAVPATHLLSNGGYSVMVTAAGAGYSRWRGRAITRWREDPTCDDWGSFVFLRDVVTDRVWSAGFQPSGVEADRYDINFTDERAELTRQDGTLITSMDIVVSVEEDAEVRRVRVTNTGAGAREIEITSYLELALVAPADDAAHPVFAKMFVQTEYLAETGVVLATRRRRHPAEAEIWAAHLVVVEGEAIGDLHVETDRAAFIGRGQSLRNAAAMTGGRPLSGTVGIVLDPIFSLRRRVRIAAGASAQLSFWTMAAATRPEVLALADRHREPAAFDRAFTLAWTQSQVQLRHLGITQTEALLFQLLAGYLVYASAKLRPAPAVLQHGGAGPALLWAHGISGDLPILLVRIDDVEEIDLVRQLLQAHEYWRMKDIDVDLVILNEKAASYNQDLQDALDAAVRVGRTRFAQTGAAGTGRGGVFELRADLIPPQTRALLLSVARVVLVSRRGSLADQLERLDDQVVPATAANLLPAEQMLMEPEPGETTRATPELEFFNGLGGFADHGRQYVTILTDGQVTPAPWTNVIANPAFGFLVTADGGGYSWWLNSRENQITPWSNDPVSDRPGDIIYLRDQESGRIWGPTPLPARQHRTRYEIYHGLGYSRFISQTDGIAADLLQFVPVDDAVKISRLTLRNTSLRTRRLSVTSYVEWVLGPSRPAPAPMIVTEAAAGGTAVLARNPWTTSFGPYVAFSALRGMTPARAVSLTGDRREFIGRNGSLARPAALARSLPLSNLVGAGLDPCAALQTRFELQPGESLDLVILLGAAESADQALALIERHGSESGGGHDSSLTLAAVAAQWDTVVGAIQVTTPDRAMDIMINSWLLYQTLACRVWARAGFYQASGAFGFRDQLQDGMALAPIRPDLTRAHLLRAAARQFPEGDVQHWWLPHAGQGVRTRISDDRIWLAHATSRYISVTGDAQVLDEAVPFLDGPCLAEHEHEAYFQPTVSSVQASLFEHCALGLDQALQTGPHGLPLIGTGDWNDGLNAVGAAGRGESVWLGWFLYATLQAFIPVAQARGQAARAAAWQDHAAALCAAIEREAWDGDWYRRGYYDDGTPLGAVASSECRIDAIAQSWAVISGGADKLRAARAMAAVDEQLVRRHDELALLFTPPFDRTALNPGYIKAYPPGIRENGGQYTHAAIWSVIALAMRGEGDRAGELFGMLNPIRHAQSAAGAHRYRVEPYVVAADIYAASGHVGRGGWTWYTGSAGWMYRAGVEYLLGLQRLGPDLCIDPCVPRTWPGFSVELRNGTARYDIVVANPEGVCQGIASALLDEEPIAARPVCIRLVDDARTHKVRVVMGVTKPASVTPARAESMLPL